MSGHTFRFRLQENELSSVITQTVPVECTHPELSLPVQDLEVCGFRQIRSKCFKEKETKHREANALDGTETSKAQP